MRTYFTEIANYEHCKRQEIINAILDLVKDHAKNGEFKIAETEQPFARFDLNDWTTTFNIREYVVTSIYYSKGFCDLIVKDTYDDEDWDDGNEDDEKTFELGEVFDLVSLAELHDAIVQTIQVTN